MAVPNIAPLETELFAPFWEGTTQHELRLPACSECGSWQWYPTGTIPCHPDAQLEWRTVPTEGRVFTYTTVERAFSPDLEPPLTVGMVELDGVEGPKLITTFVDFVGEPTIGDRVQVIWQDLGTHVLPTFGPAPQN